MVKTISKPKTVAKKVAVKIPAKATIARVTKTAPKSAAPVVPAVKATKAPATEEPRRRGVPSVVPENMAPGEKAEYDALVKKARANALLNSAECALVCCWARNTWYIYLGREGAPKASKVEGVQRWYKGREVLKWKKLALEARPLSKAEKQVLKVATQALNKPKAKPKVVPVVIKPVVAASGKPARPVSKAAAPKPPAPKKSVNIDPVFSSAPEEAPVAKKRAARKVAVKKV